MEALRQIPPVNDVLRAKELADFQHVLAQPFAAAIINDVLAEVRRELIESKNGASRSELTAKIAAEIARRLRATLQPTMRRVINASGVVLHTNLGRAPLPDRAIQYLREVSTGYSNLEFDTEQGRRGKRDVHVERTLQQLLGCEAAIVVNNNAAAVFLVLNTIGEGGDVVVSRGEEVEIGDSFRIPEIMGRSGARLREVGTTNRTRIKDYDKAINENTRLLLRVHPSNFRVIGFTERPSLQDVVELGRRRNIPTYEDLGSGCAVDMKSIGIADEPLAIDSIRAGIDLISFSGDKLLGGPQAGIIAGKKALVERIRSNPIFRALRVDKLTIAVLDFVLRAYLRGEVESIPIWKMLRMTETELKTRASTFAQRIGTAAQPIALESAVGGGSAPEHYLPSWGVVLNFPNATVSEIEGQLLRSTPPVIARITENQIVLDFRTIFPEQEDELFEIIHKIQT